MSLGSPSMSLKGSSGLSVISKPIRTTKLPGEDYVLSLASLPSVYAVGSSASVNNIHLFDKGSLRKIMELSGNHDSLKCMRTVGRIGSSQRETLISCGKDGTVKAWDERSGSVALEVHAYTLDMPGRRALLSCDVSFDGLTIAAGTELQNEDASLLYWDPRSPAIPSRIHSCTHSDDITAVHFLKPHGQHDYASILLSASSDGLITISEPGEEDEGEAVVYVGNWNRSVAQVGWIHTKELDVWSASDMETFADWSAEVDLIEDFDIRKLSMHKENLTWATDYLIGCHNSNNVLPDHDNELNIFMGSNSGGIAQISRFSYEEPESSWLLHRVWTGGHKGVVRSVLWDESNHVLLTGGEDSRLNMWSNPPLMQQDDVSVGIKRDNDSDGAMDVDIDSPQWKKRRT